MAITAKQAKRMELLGMAIIVLAVVLICVLTVATVWWLQGNPFGLQGEIRHLQANGGSITDIATLVFERLSQ